MEGVPGTSRDGLFVNDEEYAESEGSNGEHESDVDEAQLDVEIEPGHLQSSDDDVHIPHWSLTTAGLRRIPFTKDNSYLIPVPGRNRPFDWFTVLLDDIFLECV
ncbi:hypothetical protein J6590_007943 [Homalodisca vitripennis]|nr:hypothetical protein J6590_093274 [Homalodisca vitripennis]KAG8278935.1 hypothetical protein J6590_007943 [Homalodisca vitripennis]